MALAPTLVPKKVWSITQYNTAVERKMRGFPQVWVKGVITQLNVRGGIVYLTLAEFADDDARPKAVLEAMMWTSEYEMFNARFARLPSPLSLRVELKVAMLLEAGFYVPSGRFRPRVVDVDEAFTLGELTLTRQKILERLMKDGLLGLNKQRVLSDVPLRIGLITAQGSAAYQDFTSVLLGSGFSFRIYFVAARMQGEATETTVLRSIQRLSRIPLDAICIVRGGGSKTDLVYFDSEKICRAIARCPVPVLTGIGHEIDNSLADLVAYADKITPTDCAKFLESVAAERLAQLAEYAGELEEAWRMEAQQAWHDLSQRATTVKHEWDSRRATEDLRCRDRARGLMGAAKRLTQGETHRLAADVVGLKRGPGKILGMERLRFDNRLQAAGHVWDARRDKEAGRLRAASVGLRRGPAKLLRLESLHFSNRLQATGHAWRACKAACRQALEEGRRRLADRVTYLLRGRSDALGLKERLVNAANPTRLLGMGFAMLSTEDGKLIRGVAQVKPGEKIRAVLKDGSLEAEITSKKESP